MVGSLRINVVINDEQLVKALEKYNFKLQKGFRRLARGESIVDYALREGDNPIRISITSELKERNLTNTVELDRLIDEIVSLEFLKRNPGQSNSIIWDMKILDVISPVDKRLIVRGKKIGISTDFRELQRILADTVLKDFSLFVEADLAKQLRKGEIPVPPPVKAVVIDSLLGKNIGKKLDVSSAFISNIQFTILVRREMAKRMPKGSVTPRLPPPNPAKGLTFRSGRFVDTTEFFINFKNKIMGYYIAPPYNVFLDSSNPSLLRYKPDVKTIIPAMRIIAKSVAAEKFNIVRNPNSIL